MSLTIRLSFVKSHCVDSQDDRFSSGLDMKYSALHKFSNKMKIFYYKCSKNMFIFNDLFK